MKVIKGILGFFGNTIASLLASVLFLALMLAPLANAVASFTAPTFIPQVISTIDFETVIESNEELKKAVEESGVEVKSFDALMKSKAVSEVLELYSEDLSSVLEGKEGEKKLTKEAISAAFDKHSDEIVEIIKDNVPDAKDKSDAEIKDEILSAVDENGEQMFSFLPSTEDFSEMFEGVAGEGSDSVTEVFSFIRNDLMRYVYLIIAGIALLIFLVRCWKFKGFMWDGIVFALGSIALFAMTFGLEEAIKTADETLMPGIADMFGPYVSVVSGMITPFAIGYAIIGVVLIALFIVLRIVLKTMKAKKALAMASALETPVAAAEEAPVEEAPAEEAPAEEAPAEEAPAEEAPAEEETKTEDPIQ